MLTHPYEVHHHVYILFLLLLLLVLVFYELCTGYLSLLRLQILTVVTADLFRPKVCSWGNVFASVFQFSEISAVVPGESQ